MLSGLRPEYSRHSKRLILGTFPSRTSLEKKEYYGNPRNQFWKIIEAIFNIECVLAYDERIRQMTEAGLALWDVIGSCNRSGSSDKAITDATPNDIKSFLRSNTTIEKVYFNGHNGKRYMRKLDPESLAQSRYGFEVLPSSSPQNTRYTLNEKIEKWMVLGKGLVTL